MINILVTIGPASENKASLQALANKTNLFRLNGSHGSIEWHKKAVASIRSICPNAFILMDIPGIKPRTANTEEVKIYQGQEVSFGGGATDQNYFQISLTKTLPDHDEHLTIFSLNDGQFIFDLIEHGPGYVVGRSRSDFILLPKKGINLPNSVYNEQQQFTIYKNFISQVIDLEIDALGLSFVQTGNLVSKVRKLSSKLLLISKIENSEGLKNCTEIIKYSDAIMIDRGDLAAEIGLAGLYKAAEKITAETKAQGKPLIMATENLETMVTREVPSKSEVISIAHSASIGVDCLMLSEETATAANGHKTVSWLKQFLDNQSVPSNAKPMQILDSKFSTLWKSIGQFDSIPILIMTKSGYAVFDYFSILPKGELIIITDNTKVQKIAELFANKITIIPAKVSGNVPIEIIWEVIELNKETLFASCNQIAAVYVSKYVKSPRANCITIFDKVDF